MNQFIRGKLLRCNSKTSLHLRCHGNGFGIATEYPAAGTDKIFIVIHPAGARQFEQALALVEAALCIGRWINKNMLVVKRGHQTSLIRTQQTITKNIAAHIANADNCKIFALHINALFFKVSLHRNPGTARGDAHTFMVVALAAAGSKGISQPEVIFRCNAIGNVRKTGGAFIRSHHQIRIILIKAHQLRWRDYLPFHQVIGQIQEAANKNLVTGNGFLLLFIPTAARLDLFAHKPAFGAAGHDHRIFDLLCFDQTQYFGAVILQAIRPAQTAARYLATT